MATKKIRRRASLVAVTLAAFWVAVGASSVPIRSHGGMVASQNQIASQIGARVLEDGGTAVDAAVATAFALAVVHPSAGNIGGGGFMVYRPTSGQPVAYDFREVAPAKATATSRPEPQREGVSRARGRPPGGLPCSSPRW